MTYNPQPANQEFGFDAGGRTRSSLITTLFDGKTLGADDPLIWENVGDGVAAWAENACSLSVSATPGQFIVRRGRQICPYFSGKSQLIELTFDGFAPQSGVTKRVGYFSSAKVSPFDSSKDGFWLESDGETVRLVIQRAGVEIANVPWTSWRGYSSLVGYDWDNFTVAAFDFLWLGGTSLRLFIKTSAGFVLAHVFDWAGTAPGTFILSPASRVRYEVRSTAGAGEMKSVCSQVASEGDVRLEGKKIALHNSSPISANAIGTVYAMLGIKKLSGLEDINVRITGAGIVNTSSNDAGLFFLLVNPTLSAALTYSESSRISSGVADAGQTVTALGRPIFSGPSSREGAARSLDDNALANIGCNADGTSDELVLAYMPVTTNQTVYGSLEVKEI